MFSKTLIAAALLTAVTVGTATTASAHPNSYKRIVTVEQCIGGSKYLVRKARSGKVLSKVRVGRCYSAKRHRHYVESDWRSKRIVKRIQRKAFGL